MGHNHEHTNVQIYRCRDDFKYVLTVCALSPALHLAQSTEHHVVPSTQSDATDDDTREVEWQMFVKLAPNSEIIEIGFYPQSKSHKKDTLKS